MSDPTISHSRLQEYQKRIAAMLADPECTGDLLLLGLSLLDYAILKTAADKTFQTYAEKVIDQRYGSYITEILRKDIRRYDAIKDADAVGPRRRCGAPMVRRHTPCGNSATVQTLLTDADTGRKQWLAACTRHREWFNGRVIANRGVVDETVPAVSPAANAGGVLARHIPEIDWPAVWVGINPKWTAPPEGEPIEVPVFPRLRLVLGGA